MDFGLTPEQERLKAEVREFLTEHMTEEVVEETEAEMVVRPHTREFLLKMGEKGWVAPEWPKEYGGLGGCHIDKQIIYDELSYFGGPDTFMVAALIAGPIISRFGSEEQKRKYLPRIARGELVFALGYTEPEAGSDLGSANIRATEDGDYYVINGQKTFNSSSHLADYHWLLAKTDPDAPKHKGLSLFIVDLKSPGIAIRPQQTMASFPLDDVFYEDVRVPKENLVGEQNRGFYYVMAALDFERMLPVGRFHRHFEMLVKYTKETQHGGQPLFNNPLVRDKLAEMAIELKVIDLCSYRVAWMLDNGLGTNIEASMLKLLYGEGAQRLYRWGTQIMGLYGQLQKDSALAPLGGVIEHQYRFSVCWTIGGGTSELMRNIIATRGLGLSRE